MRKRPIAAPNDPHTKSTRAYELLKDRLRRGQFVSGERLTELGLAKTLNMGRAPIREAMLRLEAEGLIVGGGAYGGKYVRFIEDLSQEQVLQSYELREVVEGLAARLAAMNMNGWQIEELRRLGQRLSECTKSGDREGQVHAASEFHRYLVLNCGNQLVIEAWERYHLTPVTERSPEVEKRIFANMPEDEFHKREEEWTPVVNAIASHSPEDAERATREVIRRITDAIRRTNWNELQE